MDMVEVDGLQIAYERVGSGPALVLLHGCVGDGPSTWRRQLDGLSDEFTVVAWDAPGAGRSTDPPERFRPRWLCRPPRRISREVGSRQCVCGRAVVRRHSRVCAPAAALRQFSKTMPRETVDDFRASMQAFHPSGFRAMARASAEDVRDVLPHVDVPTLLVYGERDVRAPLTVAEALHGAIFGSRLVVLPDAGHVCNVEAPDEFNIAVRDFLHDSRS